MNILTVGIIGGTGKMGSYFARFFTERNFSVLVSDENTDLTNEQLVEQSDLVIFSVPIDKTVSVIQSVSHVVRKDHLLFDFTSIKKKVVEAMMETNAEDVVGGHPMFSQTVPITNQVVVLSPGRGEKGLEFLQKLFSEAEARVKVIDAQKHDQLMSVVQGLTHFTDITLAKALANTGLEIHDFISLQSPAYRLKLVMMGRILAQDARLYGNIQIQNPFMDDAIQNFMDAAQELKEIVEKKDLGQYMDYFDKGAEYLDSFAETAMSESNIIIEQIFQKKNETSD